MGDIHISVILPVYGVEKYIGACIESLKSQQQEGLEFIFVDDCSPDRSVEQIEAFAAVDSRVRLIRQPANAGAGAARNRGIEAARGEFLSFIDPDDWMDQSFYRLLWAKVAAHPDCDIVKGRTVYIEEDTGERVRWWERLNGEMRKQLSQGTPLYLTPFHDHFSALFRASLFADGSIRYGTTKNGEDTSFLLRICLKTQRIEFADDAIYYYRGRRAGAATRSFSEQRLMSELQSLEDKISILRPYGLDEDAYRYIRRRFYYSMIQYCMAEVNAPDLRAHEDRFRARLRALAAELPDEEMLMNKSAEMQLLMRYDTLMPVLKRGFHCERIRRWTQFVVTHPDVAGQYAKDYAIVLLQAIREYLTDSSCDLREKGFFATVLPQWRTLRFGFRIKVLWMMVRIPIRMIVLGSWKRIMKMLGLSKSPENEHKAGKEV